MAFRVIREDGDRFVVDGGRGEFTVAKSGLSAMKREAWTKMCKGGEVPTPKGMAEGGEIEEEIPVITGDPEVDRLIVSRAAAVESAPPAPPAVEPEAIPSVPAAPPGPVMDVRTGRPITIAPAAVPAAFTPPTDAPWPSVSEAVPPIPSHGPVAEAAPEVAPVASHAPAPEVQAAPEPAPVPAPAPAATATTIPGISLPGIPPVQGEVAGGRAQQAAGLAAQAEATQRESEAQAQILAQAEQRRAAAQKDYETRLSALQSKGDALYQNILDKKVDPRRLWGEMGAARKVTASIGMILGGLGAGLTGGKNYAVEIIDRAIQRDIDAQKTEIEKGQNLLAHNLRQTDDLRLAHQLTRADLLDASAAQIQRAAASFAGDKAKAAAEAAIGNLRAEAAKERQQVAATAMQMAAQRELLPLQVEGAQRAVLLQRAQQEALASLFKGVGAPLDPRASTLLPDEIRERIIYLPGGNATLATTKEGAKKVRDQVQGYQEITAAVADMRRLRGEQGRSWVPFTAERAEGQSMRRKMIGSLRLAVVGPGAMNESELKILENLIPEPGERFLTDSAFEAKLRQIEQKAYDGMWAGLSAETGTRATRHVVR
jgi:hypothetical protein